MNKNLIFDLGMHIGKDTEYYLSKGYKVVAVEANPMLVGQNVIWFKEAIEKRNLIIENKAIAYPYSNFIYFQVDENNLDKSHFVEKETKDTIRVIAISYADLIDSYGLPYYIKCDIEGMDIELARQVYLYYIKQEAEDIPKYISFELNKTNYFSIFSYMHLAGYTKFQLRNQDNNKPYSSEDFGEFLPEDKWVTIEEAMKRYLMFRELRDKDYDNLSKGWLDLHCMREDV